MVRLLLLCLEQKYLEKILPFFNKDHSISYIQADSSKHALTLCQQIDFDFVSLVPDTDFVDARRFMSQFREMKKYTYTPVMIFSADYAHILQIYPKWNRCELVHLPMTSESEQELRQLLNYYKQIFSLIHHKKRMCIHLNMPQGVCTLPYDDILFVESIHKKAIFHTKKTQYAFPLPLYKIQEAFDVDYMVKTHRSYIVNLHNISYLDKTKSPWEISFYHSKQRAYVSRHHQQELLDLFLSNSQRT